MSEYQRGRYEAFDHIANFINALDTSEMTAKDVRTAIYTECLEAPTRPDKPLDFAAYQDWLASEGYRA